MPRTRQFELQENICRVRAGISKNMDLQLKSEQDLANYIGVTVKTIQNKRKEPETFTLGEVWRLARTLKCPIEELCGGTGMEVREVEILAQAIRELITVKGDN